ncbi:hypothetical protein CVT24_009641 [Panaeolus cyanescens]|uniref:CFEM domain-containing protein n=1 Tax=Panaeolus cyanescens TaxID=181874 RepID=A0A409Y9Y2_9AGAR|nr:hypothetical protein CVT24_009641 [Panaeolus cyanescens]
MSVQVCLERELSDEHLIPAAQRAIEINPDNAPPGHSPNARMTNRLALITSKKWGPAPRFKVVFVERTPADLRSRIVGHMNAWSRYCNVEFREDMKNPTSTVRVSLLGKDYSSYLGTDINHHQGPQDATMWLGGFNMDHPESEFRRVVRHETGHTLGFHHEHLRRDIVKWIDEKKAIKHYSAGKNGWKEKKIRDNVLTPLNENDLTATKEVDGDSIMCYFIGGLLLPNAPHFAGGRDISRKDAKLAREIYPMYVFSEIAYYNSGAIDITSYYNQVYMHKRDGTVWSWDGDQDEGFREWTCVDDERRTFKIVAAQDRLYQRCQNGEIWMYDVNADEWNDITGGMVTNDEDDEPTEIVAFDDQVYQQRTNGHIYRYEGTKKDSWTLISPDRNSKDIFGQNGKLMQIREGMGGIWLYTGRGKEWKPIRGSTKAIQVAATRHHIYALDWEGQVSVLEDENTKKWRNLGTFKTRKIHADEHRLFRLDKDDYIHVNDSDEAERWSEFYCDLDRNPGILSAGGGRLYKWCMGSGSVLWIQAIAQSDGLADLPDCAVPCLNAALQSVGCAENDITCFCANPILNQNTMSCVSRSCPVEDRSQTSGVLRELCENAPPPPSSSSSTSVSSSSSATSASSATHTTSHSSASLTSTSGTSSTSTSSTTSATVVRTTTPSPVSLPSTPTLVPSSTVVIVQTVTLPDPSNLIDGATSLISDMGGPFGSIMSVIFCTLAGAALLVL